MKTNYLKENIKEPHVIALIVVSAICYFEMISELSFSIVGFGGWIFPWSFLILIFEGFFFPVIISFLMLSSVIYGLYASWKGGIQRVIGKYFILSVIGFILANWLTVILYKSWSSVSISEAPRMSYVLFNTLPHHGREFNHFIISFFASYALIILLLCGKLLAKKKNGKNILGGAHFSSVFEAKKSGLFAEEGIVLGKAFGKTLKLPGFESILVTAPTGGGKTTSIAIPNLIEWQGSGIFNDLKGELFEKTAHYRQKNLGNICFRFSPTDQKLKTHRYNPFYYVSKNPNLRIRDLQLIAETLIPSERVDGGFWYTSSREIFLMLALYLFEKNGVATLSEIHDLSKEDNFFEWLKLETTSGEIKNTVFYQCAFSLLNSDPKSQKNILKDFHSRMILFVDPMVRHATSGNDFDLREMRKTKMSIYINIQDSDKQRLKPILTLFWAQFIHLMTEREPNIEQEPYPVLALLDEFGNMASIEKLKEGMSFFRSYRIRAIVIVQYLAQIVSAYGQHGAKGFLNAKVKIAFALNDMQDAQFFSESLGKKTIEIESHSSSRGHHSSSSRNQSLQSHPLMTPDEIMRMNPDSEIILLEARPPIKAKKCPWYEDLRYRELLNYKRPLKFPKIKSGLNNFLMIFRRR